MLKNLNLDEFQKLGQHNMDAAMKVLGEWNKGWQAIAAEITAPTGTRHPRPSPGAGAATGRPRSSRAGA